MRTIGVLGGMSWESTAAFYRMVNQEVARRLGGHHSAKCVIVSVEFDEILALERQKRWPELITTLVEGGRTLERAGADLIVLCCNAMHRFAAEVQAGLDRPLLHLADPAGAAATRAGLSRVGLLGARPTMEEAFYRERLASHGLKIIIPEYADRVLADRIITDELAKGVFTARARAAYTGVINALVAAGAEGVVLGCTEIELLVTAEDSPVPLFPTSELSALAAVEAALGGPTHPLFADRP